MKQIIYSFPNGQSVGRYPLVICDEYIELAALTSNRRRLNHLLRSEYEYRCSTVVSEENHGYGYSPICDGIPLIYFRIGQEGNPNGLIGLTSEEHKIKQKAYDDLHRLECRARSRRYKEVKHLY